MEEIKSVPTGVKIISILYYIGAAILGILGLLFLFGAGAMGTLATKIPFLSIFGAGFFIIAALLMIGFSALYFFVGRGLWKTKQWARVIAIVLSCIGFLLAIVSLITTISISSIFNLLVNGAIGGYLLFSKSVKSAFA